MRLPKLPLIFLLLLTLALAATVYGGSLMTVVSGSDSAFTIDTGEFQVALAEWGTAHYTGYPLYMLIGSPFVDVLRWLGVPPKTGASLYSLFWAALALCGTAALLYRQTGRAWLAAGVTAVCLVAPSVWVHGVIAEVYSLSMALTVGIVWLALDLLDSPQWDDRRGWWLAFLGGLGVAHHRLIGLALPAVAIMLLPAALRYNAQSKTIAPAKFGKWLVVAVIVFVLGFAPYLDMPWRVWRGATWTYGQPHTWNGFWEIFFGTEVQDWQKPVFELPVIAANLRDVFGILIHELTAAGLIAAVLGTAISVANKDTRRAGLLLTGIALWFAAFAILVRQAVLVEAELMKVSWSLLVGLALGLHALANHATGKFPSPLLHALAVALTAVFIGWSAYLYATHRPFILSLTRDTAGEDYIGQFEKLNAPADSVIMAPWGWRYFALSYAQRVEGRLGGWNIVDHRADFAALTQNSGVAYTAADTFYIFTADDFWKPRFGGAHLTSAGAGLVAIQRQPTWRNADEPFVALGDGVGLMAVEVRPPDSHNRMQIILWWTATQTPTRDYSTFVHVTDGDTISAAEDLIAQSDQVAPVYAWYATTKWQAGEVVREDHTVTLPPDTSARLLVVGMYYQDEAGNFHTLGSVNVRHINDAWQMER